MNDPSRPPASALSASTRRVTRSSTRTALSRVQEQEASRSVASPVTEEAPKRTAPVLSPRQTRKKAKAKAPTPCSAGCSKIDCAICMDVCGTEGGVASLSCRHEFCRTCLATHLERQKRHELAPSCPLCKRELKDSEVNISRTRSRSRHLSHTISLTHAQVKACGPGKAMQEESEDEGDGVMVVMEFEGEDGEEGFWVGFDGADDDDGFETGEEGEEGEFDGEEGDGPVPWSSTGEEDGGEEEEEEDTRPYGGWRWSVSHRAWVGNYYCTRPPPREPPSTPWEGPDPLAGRLLVRDGMEDMIEGSGSEDLSEDEDAFDADEEEEELQQQQGGPPGGRITSLAAQLGREAARVHGRNGLAAQLRAMIDEADREEEEAAREGNDAGAGNSGDATA